MSKTYNTGTEVEWSWGEGKAEGKIVESFTERVSRTIDGNEVTRDADSDNPAYLIKQSDGSRVLKSHSELSRSS